MQLIAPPPVSCICPTYGRVALLEEAIETFLRQDYPSPKELIVVNDYAGQTLYFDHPEGRVINVPQRFHSVGEKYKAAALAAHDLVVERCLAHLGQRQHPGCLRPEHCGQHGPTRTRRKMLQRSSLNGKC